MNNEIPKCQTGECRTAEENQRMYEGLSVEPSWGEKMREVEEIQKRVREQVPDEPPPLKGIHVRTFC